MHDVMKKSVFTHRVYSATCNGMLQDIVRKEQGTYQIQVFFKIGKIRKLVETKERKATSTLKNSHSMRDLFNSSDLNATQLNYIY